MEEQKEETKIGSNRTCESCKKNQASAFCACTQTRVYLCEQCIVDHTTVKHRSLVHQLVRADIDIQNLSTYKERSEAFTAGSEELEQNLTRIDQCCQEISESVETVIKSLEQRRNFYVTALQQLKGTLCAEIVEAQSEVKESLELDTVQLKGKYTSLLRRYQAGSLQLFAYQIDTSSFKNLVQNVTKCQFVQITYSELLSENQQLKDLAEGHPVLLCESEQKKTLSIRHQTSQELADEANQLRLLAVSKVSEGLYAKAIDLCSAADLQFSLLPDNLNAAHNLCTWGDALGWIGKRTEAEEKYVVAVGRYSRLLPGDFDLASTLGRWGRALQHIGKSEEAITKLTVAHTIFSRLFPDSIDSASILNCWGNLLKNLNENKEAVAKYKEADKIYAQHFPSSIDTARNLSSWGVALMNMEKYKEACTKFAAAEHIYSLAFSCSIDIARNRNIWGVALKKMRKSEEAITKFTEADAVYCYFSDNIDTARNLNNWGDALRSIGENEEAEAKHAAANSLFSRLAPEHISSAHNLYNWGFALKHMGRKSEAVEKLEAARSIYFSAGKTADVRECDKYIAELS